jgi:hypothetical protein
MCSKSNPLVVFALDLMSEYDGEHMIFGLLGQANLTQNDVQLEDLLRNLFFFGFMFPHGRTHTKVMFLSSSFHNSSSLVIEE